MKLSMYIQKGGTTEEKKMGEKAGTENPFVDPQSRESRDTLSHFQLQNHGDNCAGQFSLGEKN